MRRVFVVNKIEKAVIKRPYSQLIAPKYWPTWLAVVILRAVSLLPLKLLAAMGRGVGLLFYGFGAARRKIALRNIQSCFPERALDECQKINRDHFRFAGQMIFTSMLNWWASSKRLNSMVEIVGREHYDQALQQGKSIILLAPHFVGLEFGLILAHERPMISMYQYSKNSLMDEITIRGRTRFGGLLVERKEPMRKLIKLLREGHPFYYLPDQDAGRKGVMVPFFNELASTTPMLGKFAEMTEGVVIPCRTKIKDKGQGYRIILGEPLENFPGGDESEDTARMNQAVAEMIKKDPSQYFWAHKRFKTRPPNEAAFYK